MDVREAFGAISLLLALMGAAAVNWRYHSSQRARIYDRIELEKSNREAAITRLAARLVEVEKGQAVGSEKFDRLHEDLRQVSSGLATVTRQQEEILVLLRTPSHSGASLPAPPPMSSSEGGSHKDGEGQYGS